MASTHDLTTNKPAGRPSWTSSFTIFKPTALKISSQRSSLRVRLLSSSSRTSVGAGPGASSHTFSFTTMSDEGERRDETQRLRNETRAACDRWPKHHWHHILRAVSADCAKEKKLTYRTEFPRRALRTVLNLAVQCVQTIRRRASV